MNFAFPDGEQHTVSAHNHLPNFLSELIVFRRERKTSRYNAELS
jgi:hypothetical protein